MSSSRQVKRDERARGGVRVPPGRRGGIVRCLLFVVLALTACASEVVVPFAPAGAGGEGGAGGSSSSTATTTGGTGGTGGAPCPADCGPCGACEDGGCVPVVLDAPCRNAGICDPAEFCDGVGLECPADELAPVGGDPLGVDDPALGCDGAACDGVSPSCPDTCDLGGCVEGLMCVDGACVEASP